MKVSPIRFLNSEPKVLNSAIVNSKYEKNQSYAPYNVETSKLPLETLKAYNPQISFTGYKELNILRAQMLEKLKAEFNNRPSTENMEKIALAADRLDDDQKMDLMQTKDNFGISFAYHLAGIDKGKTFNLLTQGITSLEKSVLLTMPNDDSVKNTPAHRLAGNEDSTQYNEITEEYNVRSRLSFLRTSNSEGSTVANYLAQANPKEYIIAVKDYSPKQRYRLIKSGTEFDTYDSIARFLKAGTDVYLAATEGFTSEQKLEFLTLTGKDNKYVWEHMETTEPELTKLVMDLSSDQRYDFIASAEPYRDMILRKHNNIKTIRTLCQGLNDEQQLKVCNMMLF